MTLALTTTFPNLRKYTDSLFTCREHKRYGVKAACIGAQQPDPDLILPTVASPAPVDAIVVGAEKVVTG